LNKVYANLHKYLSPSPSTKLHKKPAREEYVPVYPQILQSIGEMSQLRINVSARLPANHPFQPPMIEPLQFVPANAKIIGEPVGPESANLNDSSSSNPKPTTQTSEPSVLDELVNHCSGELPGFESNLEKASEIAYEEVTLEDINNNNLNKSQNLLNKL
jgi:hypothetical protein